MKTCIWCRQTELKTTFKNRAHTIPDSLGGVNICENVCDGCNNFFGGIRTANSFAVEVVFKEVFNISKHLLLQQNNDNRKKQKSRFKSQFFNINWDKKTITTKPIYTIRKGFQENLGKSFRRAFYKVFLEERERQRGDALQDSYNFIRQFSRYNFDPDYPIYYFKPKFQAIFLSMPDVKNPTIRFNSQSDELEKEFKVFECSLMGHNFCIPTSPHFQNFYLKNYIEHLKKTNHPFGTDIIPVRYVEEIDFTFKFLR
jgi:hypothetical protein